MIGKAVPREVRTTAAAIRIIPDQEEGLDIPMTATAQHGLTGSILDFMWRILSCMNSSG